MSIMQGMLMRLVHAAAVNLVTMLSFSGPGHAMRDFGPLAGTVVGKALEPLASGQGVIRILVMLW